MKGSPAKLGTIEGTAGHASALKMKAEADAASALKQEDKPTGYHTRGTEAYKDRFRPGGDLENREKPTGWHTKGSDMYGGGNVKGGTRSWRSGEKANPKLNELVKQRKGLDKGSSEYAAIQNQINKALGSKKRRGVTTTTKGDTKTTTTPGIATTDTTTKRGGKKVTMDTKYESGKTVTSKFKGSGKEGEGATVKTGQGDVVGVRKAKTKTTTGKGTDDKLKTKYDKSGEITKQKKTVKKGDVVTKTITKGTGDDVTKRVKTRKRGGTGLGSKIKGIFKKKDKAKNA